jgi:phage terminase small subunit
MTTRKKSTFPIINYLKDPSTWDAIAFETAIRADVEAAKGELNPTDQLMVGMLVMEMETLISALSNLGETGLLYAYNSGDAPNPWLKIRNEAFDKVMKAIIELGLVAKNRPKTKPKTSAVDELFATA